MPAKSNKEEQKKDQIDPDGYLNNNREETMMEDSGEFEAAQMSDPAQKTVKTFSIVNDLEDEEKVYPAPPNVSSGLKCSVHINHIVHSYFNQKIRMSKLEGYQHTLLCTQCIYDRNLSSTQIEIIPSVMGEIKQKMLSTRTLINYRKNQLT